MSSASERLADGRNKRRATSETIKGLKEGRFTLVGLLEKPPESLLNVPIHTLLRCAPHMGKAGAKRVLQRTKIYAMDGVGELSTTQVKQIIKELPPRAR